MSSARQAFVEVTESEKRLRLAMDAARMAMWEFDIPTRQVRSSPELNHLLGFPENASPGYPEIAALYFPGEEERLRQAARDAVAAGDPFFRLEYRAYRPDGSLRWFQLRAEINEGRDGAPARMIGALLDITDRKTAEEEYRGLLEKYRTQSSELAAVLKAASLATFDFDFATGTFQPSDRLNEIYGFPPGHRLTLADVRSRFHPDSRAHAEELLARKTADPAVTEFEVELKLLMPDGMTRCVSGRGEYLRDASGNAFRARGVVMDITEQKALEDSRRILVRELEHRIKNLLSTVLAVAHQTLRNSATLPEAREVLTERIHAISRAHDLVVRVPGEPVALVDVAHNALEPYLGSGARISFEGPQAAASPRQALSLALALHELATNSIKYGALSNHKGKIEIGWAVADGEPRLFSLYWKERDGPTVTQPGRRGFGMTMLKQVIAAEFGGKVHVDFAPHGFEFRLEGGSLK